MARPVSRLLKDEYPKLADQLVDQSLRDTLGCSSCKRVQWKCEHDHVWEATPSNRVHSHTGCPICNNRVVLPGFNDIATTDPEIAALCADRKDAHRYVRQSNKKITWRCKDGHAWNAPIAQVVAGTRCPYCSGRYPIVGVNDLATTHPELAEELVDKSLATKLKAGSPRKVEWICRQGHTWFASPYARAKKNAGCPYCSHHRIIPGVTSLDATHPELVAHLLHPEQAREVSLGSDRKLEWVCDKNHNHIWTATVANYRNGGCPFCDNKRIIVGENDLATTHPEIAAQLVDQSLATKLVAGSSKRVLWQCEQGHTWETVVCHRTGKHPTGCPECANAGTSQKKTSPVRTRSPTCPWRNRIDKRSNYFAWKL